VIANCPDSWHQKVVQEHKLSDAAFSRDHDLELDAYEVRAEQCITYLLSNPKPRMRVQSGTLEQWLTDGYLKTGILTRRTSGTRNFETRLEAEENVLGVPRTAGESHRPKYGYIHGGAETTALDLYGRIVVHLKSGLFSRARVIFGDSVGSTKSGGWASLAPVDPLAPTLLCRHAKRDVLAATNLTSACDEEFPYAEMHIYGPLEPADISDVVFHGVSATADLRRDLNDWSIPYDETSEAPR
jgi:hypothetical protein